MRKWCTIQVAGHSYSVPSRLIGKEVQIRLYADWVEVYYKGHRVERMERVRGEGEANVNYRHVIGSLVRKPGAFARYRFRAQLFPTMHFRLTYDALRQWRGERADVEYVRILHLAATTMEATVDSALSLLLEAGESFDYAEVRGPGRAQGARSSAADSGPAKPDLKIYDRLLTVSLVGGGGVRMTDTSVMQDRIGQLCGQFKLPTMGAQSVARFTAAGHGDALATFLEVLEQEAEDRRHRRINRLRRESRLPSGKTWETFEHDRVPLALRQQLDQLAQGSFVERGINVLAFGLPGTGKTHALCALGHRLVEAGHSVLFAPAYRLVQELLAAKRDLDLPRQLRKLDNFDFLLLDDLGYLPQGAEESEVLFTLIAERYERRSLGITSNLVFSEWERIFANPMATAAAIDRVVHHSVILEFDVPSYRTNAAQQREPGQGGEPAKLIDANRQIWLTRDNDTLVHQLPGPEVLSGHAQERSQLIMGFGTVGKTANEAPSASDAVLHRIQHKVRSSFTGWDGTPSVRLGSKFPPDGGQGVEIQFCDVIHRVQDVLGQTGGRTAAVHRRYVLEM